MEIFKTESKTDYKGIAHAASGSFVDVGQIADRIFGDDFSYGNLFAYMVRRFGYPTWGTDPYKKLACWYLTTSINGVYVGVNISASSKAGLHFGEAFSDEYYTALIKADNAYWNAWHEAIEKLALKDGHRIVCKYSPLQEEMKKYIDEYNKWEAVHYPQFKDLDTDSLPENEKNKLFNEFDAYNQSLREKYAAMVDKSELPAEPYTIDENYYRTYHHPLLIDIAKAMEATIIDLLRPTYIRDVFINAKGRFECTRSCTALMNSDEAEEYTCGYLAEPWEHSGRGIEKSYFDDAIQKAEGE